MSLARRLQRIVRAHLGSLRGSPVEKASDEGGDPNSSRPGSSTSRSTSDVPPEVAKAYRALEVPVGSDRATVKRGYRRVMKKYHQDRFDEDGDKREVAGKVSKRLNLAYERVTEYLDETDS